jgi:hypothetical protein
MMSGRRAEHGRRRAAVATPSDAKIDESLEETFPASGPAELDAPCSNWIAKAQASSDEQQPAN